MTAAVYEAGIEISKDASAEIGEHANTQTGHQGNYRNLLEG